MVKVIKSNKQVLKISEKDLQKPARTEKYDSTIDERCREYTERKPEPRLTEYR